MNGNIYKKYADGRAKKSPLFKDSVWAFNIGGAICTLGEGLRQIYINFGLSKDNAGMLTSTTLVFLTALLTGLGIFDNIAKRAGAGTVVPITGFANSISAAAIDNKSEGFVLGVGAKIFAIAGPVILFGLSSGVVYGLIYFFATKIL